MVESGQSFSQAGSSEFITKLISPKAEEHHSFVGGIIYEYKNKIVAIGAEYTDIEKKSMEQRFFSRYGIAAFYGRKRRYCYLPWDEQR